MLIEINRGVQQIPVLRSGVASGLLWAVEPMAMNVQSDIVLRVYVPWLYRDLDMGDSIYENDVHTSSVVFLTLPPAVAGSRGLSLCRPWRSVEKLRIPEFGWVDFDYAANRKYSVTGNASWQILSGFSPQRCLEHWQAMSWEDAYENMQPAAEHVCAQLVKIGDIL